MIAVAAIVNQKHSNWTAEFSIGSRSPRGREIVVSSIERRQWSASASRLTLPLFLCGASSIP